MKKLNVNTNGNKKLKNNENVRFMIWNLPAKSTCPYATEHCKKACYACKAERVYPQVLPSRQTNYIDSNAPDFVQNMIFTIETELKSKKYIGKKCVFRIHESGDFYNIEYAEKWVTIAQHFENDNRIVFLAYTKSILYFLNLNYGLPMFPQNFVIRFSLWDDTREDLRQLSESYNMPIYTALSAQEIDALRAVGHRFEECRCDDCANCGACWNKEHKNIIVKIH